MGKIKMAMDYIQIEKHGDPEVLKLDSMPVPEPNPGEVLIRVAAAGVNRPDVMQRKGLYPPNFVLPSRMIKNGRSISKKLTAFNFYGPTCDSLDYMKGPFLLPNNIKEGDYIELGQLGAYGTTFRTKFNGFYSDEIYQVDDKPILSMYDRTDKFSYLVA